MDWGDVATWAGAVGAAVAAFLAGSISFQLLRRERRQAVADIHTDLTTGETAHARDVIGTAIYAPDGLSLVDTRELIQAFFKLYWAVQRAENTYRVYGLDPATSRQINGQHENYLTWNFREIVQNIVYFHRRFGGELAIQDEDAWESFQERLKGSHPQLYDEYFVVQQL